MLTTWTTPKTDWAYTDFINYTDYNRIVGNVEYIIALANQLEEDTYPSLTTKTGYLDYPYASEWNAVENCVSKLATKAGISYVKQTYMNNGFTIDANELNNIESMELTLKGIFEAAISMKYRLAYTFGRKRSEVTIGARI